MIKFFASAAVLAALLATPSFAQDTKPRAILKICKVAASSAIPLNTQFTFTVNPGNQTVMVPAGLPPGGTCWFADTFTPNSVVQVTEQVPPTDVLLNITSSGPVTTSGNTATVTLVPGVTVVTFTNDRKKIGYIEICKYSEVAGNYTFDMKPGGASVTLPAMGCSPPIQVPAGSVTINEAASGSVWTNCYTWQAGLQVPCSVAGNTTTVAVVPGSIQSETFVFAINSRRDKPGHATDDKELQQMLQSLHAVQ